jgi:7tm Chemosensory receptor
MWAVPIFNHLVLLVEIKRKRKVMIQFQQRLAQVDRQFREHFAIGFLFDQSLRVTRVKIVGIQIFVCLFFDLFALYLYRKVKLFFYYWMTMMWSMNGVRVFLCHLLTGLATVDTRLEGLLELLGSVDLQMRWKNYDTPTVCWQIHKISGIHSQVEQLNDRIHAMTKWILLCYGCYVFYFWTYNSFWLVRAIQLQTGETINPIGELN